MKILQLVYTTGLSGAEKYVIDIIPGLKEHNIECHLICVGPKYRTKELNEYCDLAKQKGITTTLIITRFRIEYIGIAKFINQYVNKNKISIIHSHLFNADILAVLTKKFFNKKIFLLSTKHGYSEDYLLKYKNDPGKTPHDFYYYATRFIIKKIDRNITVSKSVSDLYYNIKLTQERMPYIHHGVSIPQSDAKQIPDINGHPKLLVVGRLEEIKGHSLLINALPKVIKKYPDLKVLFLGNGSLRNKLINQASELSIINNVEFLGFQNPANYSSMCAVMVIPSLYEAFGLVYIESFALKMPVIAFDVAAANEIIQNNETGFLVNKDDTAELAEKIIYVLDNPTIANEIVENAHNIFLSYYNMDRLLSELANLYRSI